MSLDSRIRNERLVRSWGTPAESAPAESTPAESTPVENAPATPVAPRPIANAVKRAVDVTGSAALLTTLGIPMLALATWIRVDSPGRALFVQTRVGKEGQHFQFLKFRSMIDGAEELREELREEAADVNGSESVTFKLEDDPRITRAGRFLRHFSLDELPQLLNVLRGEMSLVGPRPHPLDDVERYSPEAMRRLDVKPGITGLWQVSGRSDLDWDESLALDLHYVDHWSPLTDFVLLARTIPAVLRGRGAY